MGDPIILVGEPGSAPTVVVVDDDDCQAGSSLEVISDGEAMFMACNTLAGATEMFALIREKSQEREADHFTALGDAYVKGAAVAFGLMGMAETIRAREVARQRQRDHADRMAEADMGQ